MDNEIMYQGVHHWIQDSGSRMSLTEIHGSMVGALCVDQSVTFIDWINRVIDAHDQVRSGENLDSSPLAALFDKTRNDLESDEFEFDIVLPDDDVLLGIRAVAVGEWCEGFLYGLGYSQVRGGGKWPGDCDEILRDLVKISRVDPNAEGEADEISLSEITEYLRVAVQLLQAELRADKGSASLH